MTDLAREWARRLLAPTDIDLATITEQVCDDTTTDHLSLDERIALARRIDTLVRLATVTATWPDEPTPDVKLTRIARAHSKHVTDSGATSGDCNECGWTWPCPTYAWATTDRDPDACWDPADDDQDAPTTRRPDQGRHQTETPR